MVYVRVELCLPERCLSPSPQYLWVRPYLEIRSLWMIKLRPLDGPNDVWCPYKMGKCGTRERRTQREDNVKTREKHIYKPRTPEVTRSWERGLEHTVPHSFQKEPTLPTLWTWALASGLWDNTFLWLSWGDLLGWPQDTDTALVPLLFF